MSPSKANKSPAKVSKPPARVSKSLPKASKSPAKVSKLQAKVSKSPPSLPPKLADDEGARRNAIWNARAQKSEGLADYLEDLGFDRDVVDVARPDPHDAQTDGTKQKSPVQKRIDVLKTMLTDELCPPDQKVNILKAIDLYEQELIQLNDALIYIQKGKVVEIDQIKRGSPVWTEVSSPLVLEADESCWMCRSGSNIRSLGPCISAQPVCSLSDV